MDRLTLTPLYTDLPTPTSFRVLHLEPGAYIDDVVATLEVADLLVPPEYRALSYVWGPANPRIPATLNGHASSTTENLTYALRNIRSVTAVVTLWVDVLCINQASITERTSQVRMMRSIYKKASRVIIWLGLEQTYIPAALELLALAARRSAEENPEEIMNLGDRKEVAWDKEHNERMGFPPRGPEWHPIGWLLHRPWFRRIWVVQEAATSMDSLVVIGEKQFPWHDFMTALFYFDLHAYPNVVWTWETTAPLHLFWQGLSETKISLLKLHCLAKAAGFESTDERDMSFALVGISLEGGGERDEEGVCELVAPNYALSLKEVFVNLVRHYVECVHVYEGEKEVLQTSCLDVLSVVRHTPDTIAIASRDEGFPSWLIQPGIDKLRLFPDRSKANASLDMPVELRESITETAIVLKGLKICTVTDVDKTPDRYSYMNVSDDVNPTKVYHTIRALWNTYSPKLIPFLGLSAAKQAFVDALTRRAVFNGRARTSDDLDAFLLHDPEMENWAQVRESENPLSLMNDAFLFLQSIANDTFFVTDSGLAGMGPVVMEVGDVVCVLFGGNSVFVLREVGKTHLMVGSCFVGELQDGVAVERWKKRELREEWFDIR